VDLEKAFDKAFEKTFATDRSKWRKLIKDVQ